MIKLLTKYSKYVDWNILLSMNENLSFNITLLPVAKSKDEGLKQIAPIILKNVTLEQLENISSSELEKAFSKVNNLVSNVIEFEAALEEREKATKMAKDKKDAKKKLKEAAEKETKESQTDAFDTSKKEVKSKSTSKETIEEIELNL